MKNQINKIGIIGNGSWGTALAKILTDNGHQIHWWLRDEQAVDFIKQSHQNLHYLKTVKFPEKSIFPTTDLNSVWDTCDTLIIAVPSAYLPAVIQQLPKEKWANKKIISAVKGILPDSNQLICDYLVTTFDFDLGNYVAITGPCHAEEVAAERLSYLTFSGLNDVFSANAAQLFSNNYIYTSYNHDLWGAQLAAVMKNIYAIGAGIAHGLGYGDNFLSVYITACYREMYHFLREHFIRIHPSNEMPDFHTSAYLGDLLVTCYSMHSRNRSFGNMIGKGYSVKNTILEMNMVAEGYFASKGMMNLSESLAVKLPISQLIYQILWQGESAAEVLLNLQKMIN